MSRLLLILPLAAICCSCDEIDLKRVAERVIPVEVEDKTVSIAAGEFYWVTYTPARKTNLSLELSVVSGDAVNVDLLDREDFHAWQESLGLGSFGFYRPFHGESLYSQRTRMRVIPGHEYFLLIRPSTGIFSDGTRVRFKLVDNPL